MSASLSPAIFDTAFYSDWRTRLKALILSRQWARNLGNTPITTNCLGRTAWSNGVLQLIVRGIGMRPKFIPASVVWADGDAIFAGDIDRKIEETARIERIKESNRQNAIFSVEKERINASFAFGFWADFEEDGDSYSKGLEMAEQSYIDHQSKGGDFMDFIWWMEEDKTYVYFLCFDPRDENDYREATGRSQIASTRAKHPENRIFDVNWPHEKLIGYEKFFAKELKFFKRTYREAEPMFHQACAERCARLYAEACYEAYWKIDTARQVAAAWARENMEFFEWAAEHPLQLHAIHERRSAN